MRAFGRSCRGQSRVFVKLVRHTEHKLLELGEPIATFGQKAKEHLDQATSLSETRRQRLSLALTAAMRTFAPNPNGSSTGKSWAILNSSMPMISPLRLL